MFSFLFRMINLNDELNAERLKYVQVSFTKGRIYLALLVLQNCFFYDLVMLRKAG